MTGHTPDTAFDCRMEQRAQTIVLSVAGAIDLTTQPTFADTVQDALRQRVTSVVIDLSEITFLSSPGLAVLVDAHENAMRMGKNLWVAIGTGVAKRSIELTGLGEILSLVPDVRTALDS